MIISQINYFENDMYSIFKMAVKPLQLYRKFEYCYIINEDTNELDKNLYWLKFGIGDMLKLDITSNILYLPTKIHDIYKTYKIISIFDKNKDNYFESKNINKEIYNKVIKTINGYNSNLNNYDLKHNYISYSTDWDPNEILIELHTAHRFFSEGYFHFSENISFY